MIRAAAFLLDLIFPRRCVGCGKDRVWLCADCQEKIVVIKTPSCPECQRITKNGEYCRTHRRGKVITGILVAAHYKEGPMKEAIHNFKYDGIKELAEPLGSVLAKSVFDRLPKGNLVIVPIPLHGRRLGARGFNQSELLAKSAAARLKLPAAFDLVRIVNTPAQVELSGEARKQNLTDAFAWKGRGLRGKTVLLVDDVTTTGTTLNEAAKPLKAAGARFVWGLVLAKG
jgi:ComF family protein